MPVRCGNPLHKPNIVHHDTAGDVRACYQVMVKQPAPPKVPVAKAPAPQPADAWLPKIAYKDIPVGGEDGDGAGYYCLLLPGGEESDGEPVAHYFAVRQIKEGDWKGFTALAELASDEEHRVVGPRRRMVLDKIAEDPEAAGRLFAELTVHCYLCNRRLTNKESRDRGIGPVCFARL